MNILFFTAWDDKGEQFNGKLIHDYLNTCHGHISHMMVTSKAIDDKLILLEGNKVSRFIDEKIISNIEEILSIWAVLPLSGTLNAIFCKSDIIHLEAIHGRSFLSLLVIPFLNKKIVWTIHDNWMMSGHCLYTLDCQRWKTGCGNCPRLDIHIPMMWDNTRLMWKIKYWVTHNTDIKIIVASKWMEDMIKESPILKHLNCSVIPFGVKYNCYDKMECRRELNIPFDAFVVSYRDTENQFKGSLYAKSALVGIKDIYELPIAKDGWIQDHETIIKYLAASDVFLMPSLAESFGVMAIESMNVGTPVIAFKGTSLTDVIKDGGIVVDISSGALLTAIRSLQFNPDLLKQLSDNAKKVVANHYTYDQYIYKHMNLYKSLMLNSMTSNV